MKKIDIEKVLLAPLDIKYQKNQYEIAKLGIAIDMMEVYTKFITILAIAIVKDIDNEYYKNKILESLNTNSNYGHSLGNYYYALQDILRFKHDNELLKKIESILEDNRYNIDIELPVTIWKMKSDEERTTLHSFVTRNKNTSKVDNLFLYALALRNKDAHTSTIDETRVDFINRLFSNIKIILKVLRKIIVLVLKIKRLSFITVELSNNNEYREIKARYRNRDYNLSPLVIEWNNLKNKTNFIYFLISSGNSKSEYQDYITSIVEEIDTKEDKKEDGSDKWPKGSLEEKLKKFSTHSNKDKDGKDGSKYKGLISNFMGREEELNNIESFILDNYDTNTLMIITGKPGIGKSAFVTRLQSRLVVKRENLISYLFYAIKDETKEDEFREFKKKVKNAIVSFEIKVGKKELNPNQLFQKISNSNKVFLLIIDGLDELNNVLKFLEDMKFAYTSKNSNIHIILTTRPHLDIRNSLKDIFQKNYRYLIYNHQNVIENGYSFELDALKEEDTKSIILKLLPKDDNLFNNMKNIDLIVKKSGSIPIYIHYISEEIKKKKLGRMSNYEEELEQIATKLPNSIESYYLKIFNEAKPLGRDIFIAVYFSPYGVSFDELYKLFRDKYNIDRKAFGEVFDTIDMFLRERQKDYYVFYHKSLKDAIVEQYIKDGDIQRFNAKEYINNIKKDEKLEIFFQDSGYYNGLNYIFESIFFAVKVDGDFNKTLKHIIVNSKKEKLEHFLKHNFFFLYYKYCLFSIITYNQKQINTKDIKTTPEIRREIRAFFRYFEEDKENRENTEVISYAYQLSRLIGDYKKNMKYYDFYRRANLEIFKRICLDINKKGHIEEFQNQFDNWQSDLTKEQKDILIEILALNFEIDKSFIKIYEKLDDVYQKRLKEVFTFV